MTDTTPNIPLLRKAVEWVEEQAALPVRIREWNQGDWRVSRENQAYRLDFLGHTECGTTYCVAGKVCADEYGPDWHPIKGRTLSWPGEARRLLGLTAHEAYRLFKAKNEAADVRRIAEDIAGERL